MRVPSGSIDLSTFPQLPWATPSEHVRDEQLLEDFYRAHAQRNHARDRQDDDDDDDDERDVLDIGLDVSALFSSFRGSEEYRRKVGEGDNGGDGWLPGDVGYDFEEGDLQDKEYYLGNSAEYSRSMNGGKNDGDGEDDDDGGGVRSGVEEIVERRSEAEVQIDATIENAFVDDYQERRISFTASPPHASSTSSSISYGLCTSLRCATSGSEVKFVEHLLSALEACGVDNCRIEVEGGAELPIIDGSALPWCEAIMEAGIAAAPRVTQKDADQTSAGEIAVEEEAKEEVGDGRFARRLERVPRRPITVYDGDCFATFIPANSIQFSVGVDHKSRSTAIGKRYYTWSPEKDFVENSLVYRECVAPARSYNVLKDVEKLLKDGLMRGGSSENGIVADGKYWCTGMNRFGSDEPARHTMLDLIGDLSLLSKNGNAGLPRGHIVVFKTGDNTIKASLNLLLVQAIDEACKSEEEEQEEWKPTKSLSDLYSDEISFDDAKGIVGKSGNRAVDLDSFAKQREWDIAEYEYRTGADSIDAAKMFKSFEAEKEWNRKFWESRKRDDGNAKSDEGNLDKVTID